MNKRKKSRIGILILMVFFVFFAKTFIDQQGIISKKADQYNKVQDKITQEEKIKDDLQKQEDMLGSDEYIEKVAREKLGMIKQGERMFIDAGK